MSAYIVSDEHIRALLTFALVLGERSGFAWLGPGNDAPNAYQRGQAWGPAAIAQAQERRCVLTRETADRWGQMLLDQNYVSVGHRYDESDDAPRFDYGRHFLDHAPVSPVAVLKAIDCYVYQSCEDPGWEESNARRFCDALRKLAISKLPGYDDAAWEIRDAQPEPVAPVETPQPRPSNGWRNQADHKAESAAVKAALTKAGINAFVAHGRGTAWGWLKVNIGAGQDFGEHDKAGTDTFCSADCQRCNKLRTMREAVQRIAQDVTGRTGEYGGRILVETQDHWDKRLNKSVPIHQRQDWRPA